MKEEEERTILSLSTYVILRAIRFVFWEEHEDTYLEVEEGGPGTTADQDEKRAGDPMLVGRVGAGSAMGRAGRPNQVERRAFV